ncbi:MAG: hypothetical protein AB1716_15430 [Planctomycetota bacterium]
MSVTWIRAGGRVAVCAALGCALLAQANPQEPPTPSPQAQAAQAPQAQPAPMTDAEKEALIKSIRDLAEKAQKDAAQRPANEPPPQPATVAPTTAPARVPIVPPGHVSSQPAAALTQKAGCHGSGSTLNLTPPPEGSPLPKLVPDNTKLSKEVWAGASATFEFELTNAGEGPLNVYLKPG